MQSYFDFSQLSDLVHVMAYLAELGIFILLFICGCAQISSNKHNLLNIGVVYYVSSTLQFIMPSFIFNIKTIVRMNLRASLGSSSL